MTANLKPVDFKAVAAKGCFVYCYLREDGTPYYVGLAGNSRRPTQRHRQHGKGVQIPADRARIRVMRSGLSREKACEWEKFYIARYGCKFNETGNLHNRTTGGDEGFIGGKHSEETRLEMWAQRCKQGTFGIPADQWLALTAQRRAAIRYFCTAHPETNGLQYLAGDYVKGQKTAAGRAKQKELNARAVVKKLAAAAAKYGLSVECWKQFTAKQRSHVSARWSRGKRGAELLAGIA